MSKVFTSVGTTVKRPYIVVDAEVCEFLFRTYPELALKREEQSSGSCMYRMGPEEDLVFQFTVRAIDVKETLLVCRTSRTADDDAAFGRRILGRFTAWREADEQRNAVFRAYDPSGLPKHPPIDALLEDWLAWREAVKQASGGRVSYQDIETLSEGRITVDRLKKHITRRPAG